MASLRVLYHLSIEIPCPMAFILVLVLSLVMPPLPANGLDSQNPRILSRIGQVVNVPKVSCPDMFQYQHESDGWTALITVPPSSIAESSYSDIKVTLQIQLRLLGSLPSDDFGELRLVDGKDEIFRKIQEGVFTKIPIQYRLRFPNTSSLPVLVFIKVSEEYVCHGNPSAVLSGGQGITTLTLDHIFTSSGLKFKTENKYGSHFTGSGHQRPPEPAPPQSKPRISPTPPPSLSRENHNIRRSCGQSARSNYLVTFGQKTKRGTWPWLVAIFAAIPGTTRTSFRCGGTLVSEEHVVTAAHCLFKDKDGKYAIQPSKLLLLLGKFKMSSTDEPGVQAVHVKTIIIHPDYKSSTNDADLAILVLYEMAEFTQYVQPACLWPYQPKGQNKNVYEDLRPLIGRYGTVLGWGKDENSQLMTDEPRMIQEPIVSHQECVYSDERFVYYTSQRTFCAGHKNGSGPCNGDSGGGFMFQISDRRTGSSSWFLRGVVSLSLEDEERMCDLKNYIVYTDIAKFGQWLSQFILT